MGAVDAVRIALTGYGEVGGILARALVERGVRTVTAIGAVRGVDPDTGHHYDDTKRYLDQLETLTADDRKKIFEGNARRVFPRFRGS